jgi:hypothetical protein
LWPDSAAKADGRDGSFLGYTRRGAFTGDFVQGAASLVRSLDWYREERLSLPMAIRPEAVQIE